MWVAVIFMLKIGSYVTEFHTLFGKCESGTGK